MYDVWCRMYDVGWMMYDVGCMMYGVGCMMSDVWRRMYNVGCRMYDVGCMMSDVWCRMYDVWCNYYIYLLLIFRKSSALHQLLSSEVHCCLPAKRGFKRIAYYPSFCRSANLFFCPRYKSPVNYKNLQLIQTVVIQFGIKLLWIKIFKVLLIMSSRAVKDATSPDTDQFVIHGYQIYHFISYDSQKIRQKWHINNSHSRLV